MLYLLLWADTLALGSFMRDKLDLDLLGELLIACEGGDKAAFQQLYDLTSHFVFGVCVGILRNKEDACEVAQEVYVRVWKRAGQYQKNAGNPLAWMGSIARNAAIDRLRAERTRGFVLFTDDVPDIAVPEDKAAQHLDNLEIRRVVSEMRPEYRKAVLLCYFHGYTYEELADLLAVPPGTAKTWVRRGLAAMKEALT